MSVPEEACPLGLAPTASTTATMALGDALAVALLEERGFSAEDFALLHPGGALGRRLLRVEDLMHRGDALPVVRPEASLHDTLVEMTRKRLGVTGVVDDAGALVGIVTDGDLRRGLERAADIRALTARRADDAARRRPSRARRSRRRRWRSWSGTRSRRCSCSTTARAGRGRRPPARLCCAPAVV